MNQTAEIRRLEKQLQAETQRVVRELDFSPTSMARSSLLARQLLILQGYR